MWVLEGTAGVGKTTLAVLWANRVQDSFPNGTLFVNLRGYDLAEPLRPSTALRSFLQALGAGEEQIPADIESQVGMYRSLLVGRQVLVVLDNASSAEQVRPLLPGAAGCCTLITSRKALTGLAVTDGARSLILELLSQVDADALVRGVVGDVRAGQEPEAVAHLVDLCAGLPLALRVAASRVAARRRSKIIDLVAEFRDENDQLAALSDVEDERSTVGTVFDWSYTRLSQCEALVFRRLGVHPNNEFSLHAAAAFGGVDPAVARWQVEALVNANLIEPVEHHRYRLHDLLHLYAAKRLESDELPSGRSSALQRGLSWYAGVALIADRLVFPAHPRVSAEVGEPMFPPPLADRAQAWTWLGVEQDTLLLALKQSMNQKLYGFALALANSMRFLVFCSRSLLPVRLEADSMGLLAAREDGNVEAEIAFLRRRADSHQLLGRWAESDVDLRHSAELATECGDRRLVGEALCGLGRNRKLQRRFGAARQYYHEALPLVRGDEHVEAVVASNLSQISAKLGQYDEALKHAKRALELRRRLDDPAGEGYALHDLAVACLGRGDDQAAVDAGEQAVAIHRETAATEQYLADALETLGFSYARCGLVVEAQRSMSEAASILVGLGDSRADAVEAMARRMATS